MKTDSSVRDHDERHPRDKKMMAKMKCDIRRLGIGMENIHEDNKHAKKDN